MSRIQNSKQRKIARETLWKKQGGLCVWCTRPMQFECAATGPRNPREATIEHLKRKADGGTNRLENLALACRECNMAREANPDGRRYRLLRLEGASA